MFVRGERPRVQIDVGVDFDRRHLDAARLQNRPEGAGYHPLANATNHPASDQDVFHVRHSLVPTHLHTKQPPWAQTKLGKRKNLEKTPGESIIEDGGSNTNTCARVFSHLATGAERQHWNKCQCPPEIVDNLYYFFDFFEFILKICINSAHFRPTLITGTVSRLLDTNTSTKHLLFGLAFDDNG